MSDVAQSAIEAYNKSARELAALHRERGDLVSAHINARVRGYEDRAAQGGNVSEARHAADLAGLNLSLAIAKLDGEISGLEVELRYLDQLLAHTRWAMGANNA